MDAQPKNSLHTPEKSEILVYRTQVSSYTSQIAPLMCNTDTVCLINMIAVYSLINTLVHKLWVFDRCEGLFIFQITRCTCLQLAYM